MEKSKVKVPVIYDTAEFVCKYCNKSIMSETSVISQEETEDFVCYSIFSGEYVQFIDPKDGQVFGPRWGRCGECIKKGITNEPMEGSGILDKYKTLLGEKRNAIS